jgi:hypothetical protein
LLQRRKRGIRLRRHFKIKSFRYFYDFLNQFVDVPLSVLLGILSWRVQIEVELHDLLRFLFCHLF